MIFAYPTSNNKGAIMPFPQPIDEALENYDKNKGPWRRLFRFDQAAIRALRRLSEADQISFLKIYQCFIENQPKNTQESFKVYEALLNYLESIGFSGIPETILQLHTSKLLKPNNLDKLMQLNGDQFRQLAILFSQLKKHNLLTQTNFDNITTHFETTKENIPEMLSSMLASLEKLHTGNSLTQENLNCLLQKPLQAENIASILLILDQNQLLTPENRIQLYIEKNEVLLRNEAYYAIWHPFEDYLPTIVGIHKRQHIFDQLICLTQKEEEIKEIEKYIGGLISEAKPARRYTFEKFSTAPSPRIKTRSMISDLNLTRDRPGTL
jgi:hypothetical protein